METGAGETQIAILELTTEMKLCTGTQRVNDINDQSMCGSSKGEWPCGHQESNHMEEVGEMSCYVQGVVEGQHQHVAC